MKGGVSMHDPYIFKTFDENLLVNRTNDFSNTSKRWDHYHDFYEIYYYLGNEMNYFIDNKVYSISNNDMVFIQPYLFHRTVYKPGSEKSRILILFHPKLLQQISILENDEFSHKVRDFFLTKKKFSLQSEKSKKLLYDAVMHLYNASVMNSSYKAIKMQCALIELFTTICDLSSDETVENSTPMLSPKEKLVYNVIRYINENYTLDITLDAICEKLFVSKYHLCHTFKEITGVTVIHFINKKRLSEAERLLRYSTLSITEVCHSVGFNSVGHFINLFSKNYNCTPNAFRKNIR